MTPTLCRCGLVAATGETPGRPLGLAGVAKHLAFQPVETMGGGEEPKTFRVTHHDPCRPRADLDDVSVRHGTHAVPQCGQITGSVGKGSCAQYGVKAARDNKGVIARRLSPT